MFNPTSELGSSIRITTFIIYGMTEFRSPTPPFDGPNGISVDAFTHIGKIDFLLRCIIGELN